MRSSMMTGFLALSFLALPALAQQAPSGAMGRQVTIMADIVDVSPKAKTITLKGPQGNLLELDVKNPDYVKAVKKGDRVEAVYREALAVAVEPATKHIMKK